MKDRRRKEQTGTPSDDTLSSRFKRGRRHQEQERAVEKALRESGGSAPGPVSGRSAGGDPKRLRAIPVIGRGVGGTIPGTQPESETVREDERKRRRRAKLDGFVE